MNQSIEDLLWRQYNEGIGKKPIFEESNPITMTFKLPYSKVEKAARWYVAWKTVAANVFEEYKDDLCISSMKHLKAAIKRQRAINKAEKAYSRLEKLINKESN